MRCGGGGGIVNTVLIALGNSEKKKMRIQCVVTEGGKKEGVGEVGGVGGGGSSILLSLCRKTGIYTPRLFNTLDGLATHYLHSKSMAVSNEQAKTTKEPY